MANLSRMGQDDVGWSARWSAEIGRNVAALRRERGLSARELSERCADLGYPVPRSTIANLESAERRTVPLQEVVVLARALDAPPARLLYDLRAGATPVEALPGIYQLPMDAVEWFAGERSTYDDDPLVALARSEAHTRGVLRTLTSDLHSAERQARAREAGLTQHAPDPAGLVIAIRETIADLTGTLRSTRREMRAAGITPPPVDDDLREAYEAAGGDDDGA